MTLGYVLSVESVEVWVDAEKCQFPWQAIEPYDGTLEATGASQSENECDVVTAVEVDDAADQVVVTTATLDETPDMRARIKRIRDAQLKVPL